MHIVETLQQGSNFRHTFNDFVAADKNVLYINGHSWLCNESPDREDISEVNEESALV